LDGWLLAMGRQTQRIRLGAGQMATLASGRLRCGLDRGGGVVVAATPSVRAAGVE